MEYISTYKAFVMNDNDKFNEIYNERFNSTATIKFDIFINNYQSFFFYDASIMELAQSIRNKNRKLSILFESLPKSALVQYLRKSLIDEIEFTNQIEGVISTRKEIKDLINEIENKIKRKNRFIGIVNKYLLLLHEDNKIKTSKDIRKLYDEMLYGEIEGEDKNNLPDGKIFRKGMVHVYSNSEEIIHNGVYPEDKIIDDLNKAIDILNNDSIDILFRVAMFHYLFGYIHPFYDGNGRIDRFISSFVLKDYFHSSICYRLSMSIKENLSEYLAAFKQTNDPRNRADISTFVYSFLDIINKSQEKTELYILEKNQQYNYYLDILNQIDFAKQSEKETAKLLIENAIFGDYGITKSALMKLLNKGSTMVSECLEALRKRNLCLEYQSGRYVYYKISLDELNNIINIK